jgi:deoxyribodipyrimidine photolyase-related protein
VVEDVERLDVPLASKEGFIRQVLGWREFVYHVHEATDGFRELPGERVEVAPQAGDGGRERWAGEPWPAPERDRAGLDGGATPSALGADGPLPPAFWGTPSGLACLDRVVADVWDEAYSHHITRLMILSNLATLLDVSPRELTDWFWVAYSDAYDWVVEPNVLGMGTFALGDLMTTKPYVCGSAYIHRMSDYCAGCAFDPKRDCPVTPLYWAFLDRHEKRLAGNPRMRLPLRSLERRGDKRRRDDRRTFRRVRKALLGGENLKNP